MITSEQIKAARALLSWTQDDLIRESGLSPTTIKRMETLGPGRSSGDNLAAVQTAIERAGIEFIPENGGGAGVRLIKPAGERRDQLHGGS